MTVDAKPERLLSRAGYLLLGGVWVRHDLIGTVVETEREGKAYCQVVLTLPGYKTLGVEGNAERLLSAISEAARLHEVRVGEHRAMGMRRG